MSLVTLCIKKIIEEYKTLDSLRKYIRKGSLPDELREAITEYFAYDKVIVLEKFNRPYIHTFQYVDMFVYLQHLWRNIPCGIIFRKDFGDTDKTHVTIHKANGNSPMVIICSWDKAILIPSANIMWIHEGKIIIVSLGLYYAGRVIAWKPNGNLSQAKFSCSKKNNSYLVTLRTHPELYIVIDPLENILDINIEKLSNVKYDFRRTDRGLLNDLVVGRLTRKI